MKTINLITQQNCILRMYPDGQPHVIVTLDGYEEVRVVTPIRNPLELFNLAAASNAIDGMGSVKRELVIPYLMGARSDRHQLHGDSCDLKVVADIINSLGFAAVHLFDPHSNAATELIHHSKAHNNSKLVEAYNMPDAVLICPDDGAREKVKNYADWNDSIEQIAFCEKVRDPNTGRITLKLLDPSVCEGRNCVIIDDICDGGATFLAIAQQAKAKHMTLIVSHGIFSKGLDALKPHFNHIITSDSYQTIENTDWTTCIPLNL